jgi:hypothetical protein
MGDGLKTRLETISGLRVYAPKELPDSVNSFPAALILLGDTNYLQTYTNDVEVIFRVLLLLTKQNQPSALNKLLDYIEPTGVKSIRAAIDGDTTLGGAADFAVMVSCSGAGVTTWGGHIYLSTEFEVRVHG